MSREICAADERRDPYRFGLAPSDDALGKHADPLPVLNKESHLVSHNTVQKILSVKSSGLLRTTDANFSSRSLGMLISSTLSTRLLADSSS